MLPRLSGDGLREPGGGGERVRARLRQGDALTAVVETPAGECLRVLLWRGTLGQGPDGERIRALLATGEALHAVVETPEGDRLRVVLRQGEGEAPIIEGA